MRDEVAVRREANRLDYSHPITESQVPPSEQVRVPVQLPDAHTAHAFPAPPHAVPSVADTYEQVPPTTHVPGNVWQGPGVWHSLLQTIVLPEHADVPAQPKVSVHGDPVVAVLAEQPPQKSVAGALQVRAFRPLHTYVPEHPSVAVHVAASVCASAEQPPQAFTAGALVQLTAVVLPLQA